MHQAVDSHVLEGILERIVKYLPTLANPQIQASLISELSHTFHRHLINHGHMEHQAVDILVLVDTLDQDVL